MSYLSLRSKEDWYHMPLFIPKTFPFPLLGFTLLGYFPYHTARIQPQGKDVSITRLPRKMFSEIEHGLNILGVGGNKIVLVMETHSKNASSDNFVMFFKDEYVLIGSWDEVVQWDLKPF